MAIHMENLYNRKKDPVETNGNEIHQSIYHSGSKTYVRCHTNKLDCSTKSSSCPRSVRNFGLKNKPQRLWPRTLTLSPDIIIGNTCVKLADNFEYLSCTICTSLSSDVEVGRIAKAAVVMARLNKPVCHNSQLTHNIKPQVYQACILNNLMCDIV